MANIRVTDGDFGSVAMIGLSRRFFGSVARNGRAFSIADHSDARRYTGREDAASQVLFSRIGELANHTTRERFPSLPT